jgi:DNA-binding transcriptional ArsR family regulator
MKAKREFRDREDVEVAVLDALVDRGGEGMTVFELRAAVDEDIDTLEDALGRLKEDSLISVERDDGRTVVLPDDRVVPDPSERPDDDEGLFDAIRDRLGL